MPEKLSLFREKLWGGGGGWGGGSGEFAVSTDLIGCQTNRLFTRNLKQTARCLIYYAKWNLSSRNVIIPRASQLNVGANSTAWRNICMIWSDVKCMKHFAQLNSTARRLIEIIFRET